MKEDHPLHLILSSVLQIPLWKDLFRRAYEPDWKEFFDTLNAIGLALTLLSLFLLLIYALILKIVFSNGDVTATVRNFVTSFSMFVLIVYIVGVPLLAAIKGAVEGDDLIRQYSGQIWSPHSRNVWWIHGASKFGALVMVLITFMVLMVYRDLLLIELPDSSGIVDLSTVPTTILLLILDLGYVGLFATFITQIYHVSNILVSKSNER